MTHGGERWRRALRRLAVAAVALVSLTGATPASAATFGMSDGRPVLFDSEHLQGLDFQHVRLVLPWDAARRSGSWDAWLKRAQDRGFDVLIAPTIDAPGDCETGTCTPPSPGAYRAALSELLARYPGIAAVEAWNEPNHALQPTSRSPSLAAAYFDQAAAACEGRCTAVAGNFLDGQALPGYLAAYRAALQTRPAVWGLHNYFDATYFSRSGLDAILAITDGPVWLTETGGLVTFKASGGGELPYDEARAADSLRWIFTLALQNPRLQRVYLYGMWQQPWNSFDSALLRVDNSERPSMQVVRDYLGKRTVALPGPDAPLLGDPRIDAVADGRGPGGLAGAVPGSGGAAAAAAATVAAGTLRLVGKRPAVDRKGRSTLKIRCLRGAPCVGRVTVHAGRWSSVRRVRLRAGGVKTYRIQLPQRKRTMEPVRIRLCDDQPRSCRTTTAKTTPSR